MVSQKRPDAPEDVERLRAAVWSAVGEIKDEAFGDLVGRKNREKRRIIRNAADMRIRRLTEVLLDRAARKHRPLPKPLRELLDKYLAMQRGGSV